MMEQMVVGQCPGATGRAEAHKRKGGYVAIHPKWYANLYAVIEKWVEDSADLCDWPTIWFGEDTVRHMTTAAMSVLVACEESQAVMKSEMRD